MLTIDPRPASAIGAPDVCVAWNVPARLTASVRAKSPAGMSSTRNVFAAASGGWSMPALLTKTVGGPTSAAMRSRAVASAAGSVTSAISMRCAAPASPSRTSIPTTVAPASASARVHTGPRLPSAPVTTATWPSSRKSVVIPGVGGRIGRLGELLVKQLERQRAVRGHGMAQRPADEAVELVGRHAVPGALHADVLGRERVPGRQVAHRDELLGHLRHGLDLARVHLLAAVTECDARALQVADHLAQPLRLEREAVVGSLESAVEREVLLGDAA